MVYVSCYFIGLCSRFWKVFGVRGLRVFEGFRSAMGFSVVACELFKGVELSGFRVVLLLLSLFMVLKALGFQMVSRVCTCFSCWVSEFLIVFGFQVLGGVLRSAVSVQGVVRLSQACRGLQGS